MQHTYVEDAARLERRVEGEESERVEHVVLDDEALDEDIGRLGHVAAHQRLLHANRRAFHVLCAFCFCLNLICAFSYSNGVRMGLTLPDCSDRLRMKSSFSSLMTVLRLSS